MLGNISWYAPWRRYCFYPSGGTILDERCLVNLCEFICILMEERDSRKPANGSTVSPKLLDIASKRHALDGATQLNLIEEVPK